MTKKRKVILFQIVIILAVSSLILIGQRMLNPVAAPGPVAPPPGSFSPYNSMATLAQSQNYSASRASSYKTDGGPRDNFYIPTTGEEVDLANIKGPGAITHIWTTHRDDGRNLVLRCYWEGSPHPSVEAPLGDFFGVAMGINAEVTSYPIQVSSEGRSRNCWWYMPFNKAARITVSATQSPENRDRKDVALYFYIDYQTYSKPVKDIHYFHARFQETDPPQRGKPITLLEAEGDGHFVGVVMGHRTRAPGWFGEGDDIITVDGKVSFVGTGTEDYFCDAWGFRVFSDLYHGVPALEGREVGDRLSAYRFHIVDPIPFRKSFKLDIEHWPWISPWPNTGRGYYSSVGYWYQKTVHKSWPRLTELISHEEWNPDKGRWYIENSLEAENLGVTGFRSRLGENARPTIEKALPNLSGDHMLVFDSGGDGEFSLAVPVAKAGIYTVKVHFVRAPDFGIAQVNVNGAAAGPAVDAYLRTNDLTRPIWPPKAFEFSGIKLEKGLNRFDFRINSKNEASDGYKLGIDCLVLEEE